MDDRFDVDVDVGVEEDGSGKGTVGGFDVEAEKRD